MPSKLAQEIRAARRAAGLTQKQLALRLGLKGRAVYRWERDASAPTKRNQKALLIALRAVHPGAADSLAAVLANHAGGQAAPAPAASPSNAVPVDPQATLELLIFKAADELDVPPRRVRTAIARLLERLRAAQFSLESAQRQLASWTTDAQ